MSCVCLDPQCCTDHELGVGSTCPEKTDISITCVQTVVRQVSFSNSSLNMITERHVVVADYIQKMGEQPVEILGEEQNLLLAVCENAGGGRRATWRVIISVEHEGEIKSIEQQAAYAREYVVEVEAEVQKICIGFLALMDENLIPTASTGEPKVFYYKRKGDYYRFSKVAEEVVNVPVVLQRQKPVIQKVQKTVEVSQVQYVDKIVDVPVLAQRQVPVIQTVQKTVEVQRVQLLDRVVDVSVVLQRQVPCPWMPRERIQERIVEESNVP